MLEKKSVIDSINIMEMGTVEIRRADKIFEDGKEISKSYHRHVLAPGDSTVDENERVIAVANAVWTPEVISAYQTELEKNKLK
jgi:hypothetical protein